MLIYLLKATLVWSFSLLLFETLLRKNSFHAANRFYLLGTLLAGLLLPLLEVQWAAPTPFLPARDFVQTTTAATDAIAATSNNSASAFSFTPDTLLLFFYAAGVGIALARVVRDAASIIRLRSGSKKEVLPNGCTLYETGEKHGPFSFFRTIFLSSRDAYTADELAMAISHEQQHARLLHSADMLFAQTLKVLLWFHPLVHLYVRRLRLVHEYEADQAAAQEPTVYGRFLVAQAIAAPASTLTHAFHSPIKTRIAMLTQNKRGTGRALRYAFTTPLIAALVAAFSIPGYTDERKQVGNKLFYKGNEFTMTEPKNDTAFVEDAATGDQKIVITTLESYPFRVNGDTIYEGSEVVRGAVYDGKEESASAEFFERAKPVLGKLPDGFYRLSIPSVVIGKTGKLIYHTDVNVFPCMNCKPQPGEPTTNGAKAIFSSKTYYEEIAVPLREQLALGFRFKPAEIKGKPVNAYLEKDLDFGRNIVVVQNGVARLRPE